MVRNYIRKRTKPEIMEEGFEKVVEAVMKTEMKLWEAAAVFGLNPSIIFYQIQKARKTLGAGNVECKP